MTITSTRDVAETIADLESKIETLTALVQKPSPGRRQRAWRRPTSLVGIAILAVGMLAGVAGASGNTTSVSFVALSPAKTILSNVSIAAHKTNSPVVIGGSTTVPSNATTVELTVTAKGASIGTLQFYPAHNPSGASGQTLSYPGSNVVASTTIQENVGQAGQLTFFNNGIGSAIVTAKIIGYSTQVTAGDINGIGGTSGQVLTNDGSGGASWQTPNFALPDTATTVIHPTSNAVANGSALRAALTSGSNQVVAIEAGFYDLGGANLTFAPDVSLIGAGQNQSLVRITGGSIATSGIGRIVNVGLTIVGNGELSVPTGATTTLLDDEIVARDTSTSDTLTTISGDGGDIVVDGSTITTTANGTWSQALRNEGGAATSIVVRNSSVTVGGSGVGGSEFLGVNAFSPVKIYDTQISVSGGGANVGVLGQGGPVTVEGSELHGQFSLYSFGGKIDVANSMVDGTAGASSPGTIACIDSYNTSFLAVSALCN